jgi:hypothetical protein
MEVATSVLVQGIFSIVAAGLYAWVARIVLQREVESDARRANEMFAVWWLALGILYVLAAALNVPGAFGLRDLAFTVTLVNVILVLLCIALWGLMYYLVYLYTGSTRSFWPLTIGYAVLAVAFLYLIAWADPTGFDATGQLTTQRKLTGAPGIALGLLISVPIILAALAYGSLYFRVHERAPRYRIGMVAGAFLFQFGWSAVSTILELQTKYPTSIPLQVLQDAIAVGVPILIVLAFRPPKAVRKRLGLVESGGA